MKDSPKEIRLIILRIAVVMVMLASPFLLAASCGLLLQYEFVRHIYDTIDYQSLQGVLISVSFTTLGFAFTFRNILIGRDNQLYFGFSMKSIIHYSTKLYCLLCWYVVLTVPFTMLFAYALGYRRQLFFYAALSSFCTILYFLSVMQRIKKQEFNNTVSYMLVDNIYATQETNYTNEYKNEFFDKLFTDTILYPEHPIVFDNAFIAFYNMIAVSENKMKRICSYFFQTVIQLQIKKELSQNSGKKFRELIQKFSLHSFTYYEHWYGDKNDPASVKGLIKHFRNFAEIAKDSVCFLPYSDIYNQCAGNKTVEKNNIIKRRCGNNSYLLIFNCLLGLFCSSARHCSVADYQILEEGISEVCEEYGILLGGSKISALALLVMYFTEASGGYSDNQKINKEYYSDVFMYSSLLAEKTTETDFNVIMGFLYHDFAVSQSEITIKDIKKIRKKEYDRQFGAFLNVFDLN